MLSHLDIREYNGTLEHYQNDQVVAQIAVADDQVVVQGESIENVVDALSELDDKK